VLDLLNGSGEAAKWFWRSLLCAKSKLISMSCASLNEIVLTAGSIRVAIFIP